MKTEYNKSACLTGALVCSAVSSLLAVILQFFKGEVLDSASCGQARRAAFYALLLLAFILGEVFADDAAQRLGARYVVVSEKRLRRGVFARILAGGYADFRREPQGAYIAKYTQETDAVVAQRYALRPLLGELAFKTALVSGALFLLDARLALVTLALLTMPLYVPKLIERRLQSAQQESIRAFEAHLARVSDWLAGFEVVKNYAVEDAVLARFDEDLEGVAQKRLAVKRLGVLARLLTTLMSYPSYFAVLAFAAGLVLTGTFTAGDFFVAVGMIDQLSYPIIALADVAHRMIAIRPTARDLQRFAQDAPKQAARAPMTFEREIRFDGVDFAYPGGKPVLRNFSLTVKKGKKYRLKGPSGCGKTTAVNPLLRYYDVSGGRIEADGKPLSGDPYALFTVVRQEATLFADTLSGNLTLGRDVPDGKQIEALCSVGLGSLASPQGLAMRVEEGGGNLSGGEKKRVCLARALLRDTDALILDEPLANLDGETARMIENLILSIEGKTLIVVSHAFSEEKLPAFDRVIDMGVRERER